MDTQLIVRLCSTDQVLSSPAGLLPVHPAGLRGHFPTGIGRQAELHHALPGTLLPPVHQIPPRPLASRRSHQTSAEIDSGPELLGTDYSYQTDGFLVQHTIPNRHPLAFAAAIVMPAVRQDCCLPVGSRRSSRPGQTPPFALLPAINE